MHESCTKPLYILDVLCIEMMVGRQLHFGNRKIYLPKRITGVKETLNETESKLDILGENSLLPHVYCDGLRCEV